MDSQLKLPGLQSPQPSRMYGSFKGGQVAISQGPSKTGAKDGIEFLYRTIKVASIEQKQGGKQGVFWKAQDESDHWYFVWSAAVCGNLDKANDSGEQILVRIEIKPGKDGGRPFWTITHAGFEAEAMRNEEQGVAAPTGGTSKEGGRSTISNGAPAQDKELELLKAAVALAVAEAAVAKPKETQIFLEGQVVAYRAFLAALLDPQQQAASAPTDETPSDEGVPFIEDEDIPF